MIALAVVPLVLLVLAALLVLLFLGGLVASGRRRRVLAQRLRAELEAADAALAQARAADRGWDRPVLEAAAREALADLHPEQPIKELHLVRVLDRPGTDEDLAVFRATLAHGGHDTITLRRRGDTWSAVEMS